MYFHRPVRIAIVAVALAIGVGTTACGGSSTPSQNDIVKAIEKHKSDFPSGMTHAQAVCFAKVMREYIKPGELKNAVNGKDDSSSVQSSLKNKADDGKFTKAGAACFGKK